MTIGQRAALALDLLPHLEAEAASRKSQAAGQPQGVKSLPPRTEEEKGEAAEKAADIVGIGRTTVANAKAIQTRDEDGTVIDGLRAGELNIAQAARERACLSVRFFDGAVALSGDDDADGLVGQVAFSGDCAEAAAGEVCAEDRFVGG